MDTRTTIKELLDCIGAVRAEAVGHWGDDAGSWPFTLRELVRLVWARQSSVMVAETLRAYRARTLAGMDASPEEFRSLIQALYDRLQTTEDERDALREGKHNAE